MATKQNVGRGGGHSPANVTKHLKGVDFPVRKQDLLKHAKQAKADQNVIDELQKIEDREYGSMADVMKGFGSTHEGSSRSQAASSKSQTSSRSKEPQSVSKSKASHSTK